MVFVSCVNVLYSNTSKFSESKKTGIERSVAMEVEWRAIGKREASEERRTSVPGEHAPNRPQSHSDGSFTV